MEEYKCGKSEYLSIETLNNAFEVQFCFRVTFYILSKTPVACRAMELRFSCGIIVKTIGYILSTLTGHKYCNIRNNE